MCDIVLTDLSKFYVPLTPLGATVVRPLVLRKRAGSSQRQEQNNDRQRYLMHHDFSPDHARKPFLT